MVVLVVPIVLRKALLLLLMALDFEVLDRLLLFGHQMWMLLVHIESQKLADRFWFASWVMEFEPDLEVTNAQKILASTLLFLFHGDFLDLTAHNVALPVEDLLQRDILLGKDEEAAVVLWIEKVNQFKTDLVITSDLLKMKALYIFVFDRRFLSCPKHIAGLARNLRVCV